MITTQYVHGDLLVPAQTLIAAPLVTTVDLGDVMLYAIELRIPPGHQGFTGISWQQAGSNILPFGTNVTWIIGNDDRETFDIASEVDQGFTVTAYNTDLYSHTFYIRYRLAPISAVGATLPQLVSPVPIVQ